MIKNDIICKTDYTNNYERDENMIYIIVVFVVIFMIIAFLYIENNLITTTNLNINIKKNLGPFNNYKIVHLSDLHNKSFGKNQIKIIGKIKELEPDLIFFTGDLIDSRRNGIKSGVMLLKKCSEIAPTYYITGNHEERAEKFIPLYSELNNLDITILEDNKKSIIKDNYKLNILGLRDRSIQKGDENILNILKNIDIDNNDINILLAHRPNRIEIYKKCPIDIVFSGHAHGGQIRLPIIGGLYGPDQGKLPKYDSGIYDVGDTKLIVSRGLGNSIFPQRIFNHPEIILVNLTNDL